MCLSTSRHLNSMLAPSTHHLARYTDMHCRPDLTISLETAMLAAIDRLDHQQSHCPSLRHCHYALLQKWPFPAPHHQCECSLRNALPKLSCKTEHALLLMLPRAAWLHTITRNRICTSDQKLSAYFNRSGYTANFHTGNTSSLTCKLYRGLTPPNCFS